MPRLALPKPHAGRLKDWLEFSQRQYDSLDYDPFHPILWHLQKGLPKEAALWSSTLYMAWYNIGSFYLAFHASDPLTTPPVWTAKLPIGVQRRNLRGGKVLQHLADFSEKARAAGGIKKFLTQGFGADRAKNWGLLTETLRSVWGNGRWSVYTLGELYQKVNKLPVLPTDIMNDGSSGPRTGLCYLHDCELDDIRKLDKLADRLFLCAWPRLKTKIPYLARNHYDFGMMESQLCDFNSLRKGRYYVGRDIDRDQERLRAAEVAASGIPESSYTLRYLRDVYSARAKVFDHRYLGEFNGWLGRTEYANRYYVKTGKIADHREIREALGCLF